MPLPNTGMSFTPFDPLTAAELNDLVENIEALAAGTGLNDAVITASKLADNAATTSKIKPTIIESSFTVQGVRFITNSTTGADVTGASMSYTAGSKKEKLLLWMDVMATGSAGNNAACNLNIGGVDLNPETYHQDSIYSRQSQMYIYNVAANATITIKIRAKSGTGASVAVVNDNSRWMPTVKGFAISDV